MSNYAEIDPEELACRIDEAILNLKRPNGATATQALEFDNRPEFRRAAEGFRRASRVAAEYVAECVNAVSPGKAVIVEGMPAGKVGGIQ